MNSLESWRRLITQTPYDPHATSQARVPLTSTCNALKRAVDQCYLLIFYLESPIPLKLSPDLNHYTVAILVTIYLGTMDPTTVWLQGYIQLPLLASWIWCPGYICHTFGKILWKYLSVGDVPKSLQTARIFTDWKPFLAPCCLEWISCMIPPKTLNAVFGSEKLGRSSSFWPHSSRSDELRVDGHYLVLLYLSKIPITIIGDSDYGTIGDCNFIAFCRTMHLRAALRFNILMSVLVFACH